MKTLQQMDAELAAKQEQHKRIWGEICQLQMERNFELNRLAGIAARDTAAPVVQKSQWNSNGHSNNNFDMEEMIR